MPNLALEEFGAVIEHFTSQYHHESRCINLLNREPSVWFTHVAEQLPQHVIIKLGHDALVHRIGIYLHGENNQNPKHLEIHLSKDGTEYTKVADSALEHRAGDFLFDLPEPQVARYAKFVVTENFGGSGIYVSKLFVFGKPVEASS